MQIDGESFAWGCFTALFFMAIGALATEVITYGLA